MSELFGDEATGYWRIDATGELAGLRHRELIKSINTQLANRKALQWAAGHVATFIVVNEADTERLFLDEIDDLNNAFEIIECLKSDNPNSANGLGLDTMAAFCLSKERYDLIRDEIFFLATATQPFKDS